MAHATGKMQENRTEILERFIYRAPTPRQVALLATCHEHIIACVAFLVDALPNSRDRALALTSLEDTRMRMNKAIVFADLEEPDGC